MDIFNNKYNCLLCGAEILLTKIEAPKDLVTASGGVRPFEIVLNCPSCTYYKLIFSPDEKTPRKILDLEIKDRLQMIYDKYQHNGHFQQ